MNIEFATCTRHRALEFIQKACVGQTITDTPDSAGPLLDLVEKDIVRVQDPMMYGSRIGIVPGTKWSENHRDVVLAAGKLLRSSDG